MDDKEIRKEIENAYLFQDISFVNRHDELF